MEILFVLTVAILATAPFVLLALVIRNSVRGRARSQLVAQWAQVNAIDQAAVADPAVGRYLSRNRTLRRLGFVAGCVLPPLVAWALGSRPFASRPLDAIWPWLGYLVGCLWAELSVARVPGAGPRVASLDTRRVREYLPSGLWWAQMVTPALVSALLLVALGAGVDAAPLGSTPRWTLVVASTTSLVVAAVVWWAQRRIVVRPQPFDRDEQRAVDDALRSTTMRMVGATGVAIQLATAATQIGWIAFESDPQGTSLGTWAAWTSGAFGVSAWLLWFWWVNRGWRPNRTRSVAVSEVAQWT